MIGHSYCELGHRQLCSLLQHCDTSVSIFTGNFLLDNIGSIYAVQLVYILTREAAMLLYDLGSGSWIFYRRYRKSFARRYLTVKTQQILGLWDPCLVTFFKEDCFRQIFKFLFAPKIYPGRLIQTLHSKTGTSPSRSPRYASTLSTTALIVGKLPKLPYFFSVSSDHFRNR